MEKIDFDSPIPFYIQLMDALRTKIVHGDWKPGDQLPVEYTLCDTFGVSRTVVRQALRELELEGLIYRRKGKGSFVSEPKISGGLAQKLTGFYQDMEERGSRPISKVLKLGVVPATTSVAEHLDITTLGSYDPTNLCDRLNSRSPEGIRWTGARELSPQDPKVSKVVVADEFHNEVRPETGDDRDLPVGLVVHLPCTWHKS